MKNSRFAVEHFHLVFLSFLEKKLDKRLFALKGGCNLRFYFQSIRYSEDIDLDVSTVARTTLQKTVENILDSKPLAQLLSLQNIAIEDWSSPKQTDTVQRWKIKLNLPQVGIYQPTKIEFSRRKLDSGALNSPIDPQILAVHQLGMISVPHYQLEMAVQQKIEALIHRTQTQARDLFDLDWLFSRSPTSFSLAKNKWTKNEIKKAIENAMSISYLDFSSQVVAYLDPSYFDLYDQKKWDLILEKIISRLEGLLE